MSKKQSYIKSSYDELVNKVSWPSWTELHVWSTANWTQGAFTFDQQHYFSNNCPPTSIQEHTTIKELLKVTDLLGRETKQTNQPLLYLYGDGTVEKKIVIE